jgi:hypothetical protein
MVGNIRKMISFVTLVTTLIIAIRELKIAVDAFRKPGRFENNKSDTASNRA